MLSPNVNNWARPSVSASKPGTLAPPCWPGIRVVELVVVEEVVAGEQAQTAVGVDAPGEFVVADRLGKRAGRELGISRVRRWDVLQQVLRRRGKRARGIAAFGNTHCDALVQPGA